MSQSTSVLGLKKPEGTDPFLASDFASNWQKIDDAIGLLREQGQGSIDADTLGGQPASAFAPASHNHAGQYAPIAHSHGTEGTSSGITQSQADARYAPIEHGAHGSGGTSTPSDVGLMTAIGRRNTIVKYTTLNVTFNGTNGEVITFPYPDCGYDAPPTVLLSVQVGSNFDMVANTQGRTNTECSVRIARVTGQLTGTAGAPYTNCWLSVMAISPKVLNS